jgi:hypothetical protein
VNSGGGVREIHENQENKTLALMSVPSDDSILGNLPPGAIALLGETDPGVNNESFFSHYAERVGTTADKRLL